MTTRPPCRATGRATAETGRHPPAGLGLHRVLGRQRPHDRRVPHVGVRLPVHGATPGPRPACATRRATCSSRATSASWSAARSTPTRRSPRTSASTATACTTSPGSSTTPPPRYDAARRPGRAERVRAPWTETDDDGDARRWPRSRTYGETVHTFVDRARYARPDCSSPATPTRTCRPAGRPGGRPAPRSTTSSATSSRAGSTTGCASTSDVLGFAQLAHFDDDQIRTEYSALMSTVVWDGAADRHADQRAGRRAEEEPDPGVHRAPTTGPGVQHIALRTDDIVATRRGAAGPRRAVHERARRPTTTRPRSAWPASTCRGTRCSALNILVDRDADGYLLQIFTETVTDRPTVFFEIIERHGATGFGEGNFKALFEAIERDQARRGNL